MTYDLRSMMFIAELVVSCCYGKTTIKTWMKENPGKSPIQMFKANEWSLALFMLLNYGKRWRWGFLDEGDRPKKQPGGKWTAGECLKRRSNVKLIEKPGLEVMKITKRTYRKFLKKKEVCLNHHELLLFELSNATFIYRT